MKRRSFLGGLLAFVAAPPLPRIATQAAVAPAAAPWLTWGEPATYASAYAFMQSYRVKSFYVGRRGDVLLRAEVP